MNETLFDENVLLGESKKIYYPYRKAAAAAVKQKHHDKEPVTCQEGEVDEEAHGIENGMDIDEEQKVPCIEEDCVIEELPPDNDPVVKQEPVENYENSLDGLQKMLGYDISEEVQKQKEQGDEKKKEKQITENSDADGKACNGNSLCTVVTKAPPLKRC